MNIYKHINIHIFISIIVLLVLLICVKGDSSNSIGSNPVNNDDQLNNDERINYILREKEKNQNNEQLVNTLKELYRRATMFYTSGLDNDIIDLIDLRSSKLDQHVVELKKLAKPLEENNQLLDKDDARLERPVAKFIVEMLSVRDFKKTCWAAICAVNIIQSHLESPKTTDIEKQALLYLLNEHAQHPIDIIYRSIDKRLFGALARDLDLPYAKPDVEFHGHFDQMMKEEKDQEVEEKEEEEVKVTELEDETEVEEELEEEEEEEDLTINRENQEKDGLVKNSVDLFLEHLGKASKATPVQIIVNGVTYTIDDSDPVEQQKKLEALLKKEIDSSLSSSTKTTTKTTITTTITSKSETSDNNGEKPSTSPPPAPLPPVPITYDTVMELNGSTFDRVLQENDFVFVLFYAPWCSRSHTLSMEVDAARALYNHSLSPLTRPVVFARVNGHKNIEIRDRQSIGGFPVIQLYRRKGGSVIPRGPTHPDAMATFLARQTLDPLVYINNESELESFINVSSYHSIIGIFPPEEKEEENREQLSKSQFEQSLTKFIQFSNKMAYKTPIAIIQKESIVRHLNGLYRFNSNDSSISTTYGILQLYPMEDRFYFLNNQELMNHTTKSIFKWLSKPNMYELTSENTNRFVNLNSDRPSVVLFLNYSSLAISNSPIYHQPLLISKQIPSVLTDYYQLLKSPYAFNITFSFFYADGISYKDFYERLGAHKLPSMALIDLKSEKHYIYDDVNRGTLELESMKQFLLDFNKNDGSNGSILKHSFKSDPREKEKELNIDIDKLVYLQFNSTIFNQQFKPTLIYFNANWCGFCKLMNIYFEKASIEIKKIYGDDIQIFNYDTTVNSLPDLMDGKIDGFPFISLFIQNSTTSSSPPINIIEYNNARSVLELVDFVKSNIKKETTTEKIKNEVDDKDHEEEHVIRDYQQLSLELTEKDLSI